MSKDLDFETWETAKFNDASREPGTVGPDSRTWRHSPPVG
jgi:hypothetical protein